MLAFSSALVQKPFTQRLVQTFPQQHSKLRFPVSSGGRGSPKRLCQIMAEISLEPLAYYYENFLLFSTHGFTWKFIPPHALHMCGLWEAAVKSFKFHLKRIAGAQKFNFEEFSTILTRIEGVLNSRPISALSEDPSDITPLTPGHFIRLSQTIQNMSLVNRQEKLKAFQHQFCIRWKEDYLKSLPIDINRKTKLKTSKSAISQS